MKLSLTCNDVPQLETSAGGKSCLPALNTGLNEFRNAISQADQPGEFVLRVAVTEQDLAEWKAIRATLGAVRRGQTQAEASAIAAQASAARK